MAVAAATPMAPMTTSTRSSKRVAAIGTGNEKGGGSGRRRGRGRGPADQQAQQAQQAQHCINPAPPHPRRTKRRLNSADGDSDGPAPKRSRTDVQIILETRVSNSDLTENETPKENEVPKDGVLPSLPDRTSSIDTDPAATSAQQAHPQPQPRTRPRPRLQPSHQQSRPQPNPPTRRQHLQQFHQDQQQDQQSQQDQQDAPPESLHHDPTLNAPAVDVQPVNTASPSSSRSTGAPVAGTNDNSSRRQLTKHRAKVVNGIRHELDRLHPGENNDAKDQRGGRKLRSQEATRFKSELSAYFPDYDEVIGNDPKEQHLLNVDTPILVVDSFPRHYQGRVVAPLFTPSPSDPNPPPSHRHLQQGDYPIRGYGDALYEDLFDSQRIDLDFLGNSYKGKTLDEDPLPDELYFPVHRKAARLERSIRNTERGRAQHERDQIVRLLDGLQGHDWLRIMGVSGVTESKKKRFEPARDHFIKGCEAILDKFRQWSLEEKRRKALRERTTLAGAGAGKGGEEAAAHSSDDGVAKERGGRRVRKTEVADSEEEEEGENEGEEEEEEEREEDGHGGGKGSRGSEGAEPAGANDVGTGSIAKPVREEGAARARTPTARTTTRRRARGAAGASAASTAATTAAKASSQTTKPTPPPPPPPPPREFKSFFSKKHERDAALNKHRRTGRRILAWGQPIPHMDERDFQLPEELMDEELLKARARQRRRELRSRK